MNVGTLTRVVLGLVFLFVFPTVPAVASGSLSTYVLQVDGRPPAGENWDFLRFFPNRLKVHQGDVIDASWAGAGAPHTATFLPSGDPDEWRQENQGPGGPYELVVPDAAVGGDDDELVFNPSVLAPSAFDCGTEADPCSFDGASVSNSGFLFSNPDSQPSYFVKVDAPVGGYSFLCLIHPGMKGLLSVVSDDRPVKSPEEVADQAADQFDRARVAGNRADHESQQVTAEDLPNGQARYSIHLGGYFQDVTANEYPASGITMKVGDRLQVLATPEIHTATFPGDAFFDVPFIITQCEVPGPDIPANDPSECDDPSQFQVALNNQAIFPSPSNELDDPDAFVNSGLLAGRAKFTFEAVEPGVYSMVCLVHGPAQSTTVTVEA